jgi:4-hydroxybenzoyl-CoA reductase subunit beta
MMRLPYFRYEAPRTLEEAADLLSKEPGTSMLLAGGTDLLPNMKRRQQIPRILVGLRSIAELRASRNGEGLVLGAGLTLTELTRDPRVRTGYTALWQAASQVATPQLRNMGTLGGNLCLDTRCNYYDQNYEWRKAIQFCMKKDGDICWVATSSPKCLAVSSSDTAPALIALRARVRLVSSHGERVVEAADLYQNDGIDYLTRRPDEILAEVRLAPTAGLRSSYWKLRRRGSFDFPVLSVAAAARIDAGGIAHEPRIVLGSVASRPLEATDASRFLADKPLTDANIAQAAELSYSLAKPMDNTDLSLHWRKRVTREFVTYALREIRGDDVRSLRIRVSRLAL